MQKCNSDPSHSGQIQLGSFRPPSGMFSLTETSNSIPSGPLARSVLLLIEGKFNWAQFRTPGNFSGNVSAATFICYRIPQLERSCAATKSLNLVIIRLYGFLSE